MKTFFLFKKTYHWSDSLNIIAVALLYMLFAKIALSTFSDNGVVSVVWPSSGLALAAVLLGGQRYWLGVFIGAFAGNLLAGSSVSVSALIACGNTLAVLSGAVLLSRFSNFDNHLKKPSDYLYLVLISAASASISAAIGNATLVGHQLISRAMVQQNIIDWWLGDTLGMILMTPLILVWRKLPYYWLSHKRRLETLVFFSLAFLFGQAIFLGSFREFTGPILGYWMFLFIAWAGMRYGRHGVLLIVSMITVQGLIGWQQHIGFFGAGVAQTGLFNFTCYLLVVTTVGIGLALGINKRHHIEQALRHSERRLSTAQRIAHLGSWEWNVTQDKLFWSTEMCRIFGWWLEHAEISYAIFLDTVHPDDRQAITNAVNKALHSKETFSIDYRIYLPSRELRYIYAHAEITQNEQGDQLMIGTVQDITERKLAEQALELSALVYQSSSEAMMITDAKDFIIAINPAFSKLTGYAEDEVIGKKPRMRTSGYHDDAFYQDMYKALNSTGQWQGEIWNRIKSGEIRAEWLSINSIFHRDGSVYRRVSLFYDITERKKAEELIWKQANFDTLTGLPNRPMFYDRLAQDLKKAHRHTQTVVLLFLDLDRFKEINDSFGHSVGDLLLKEVAVRLLACVRETDTVARLGGDEFTIILSEQLRSNETEIIAQRILNELVKPFSIDNKNLYISTSIGITVYPEDGNDLEVLLKNADQAMYAAKNQGRNRYSYFTASMAEAMQNRMQLATNLHTALSEEQFLVYYQPIIDLTTLRIDKAEALIRWKHPTHGMISPTDFIPIAEETGMIVDIGEWVFRQVAKQVKKWRTDYHPTFQISINKSPVQFHNRSPLYDSWAEQLENMDLSGQSIVVEITEGMLVDINDIIRQKLSSFCKANIQVALDDFGTGYSSLAYLKKFDIDYLKIDQSFVRNLESGSDDLALCQAIIVMAHALGIKVIAEGIETAQQRDLLIAAGCDYGQGYLFSRPVPAAEFERLFNLPALA